MVNAECGMRNAERATVEPPNSQFRIHHSAFICAFRRRTAAWTSILALSAGTIGVKASQPAAAVDVRTVGPQVVTGRLISFSLLDGAIVQTSTEKIQIPAADIIRVSVAGVRHVTFPQDTAGSPNALERWGEASISDEAGIPDPESWIITFTWGDVIGGRVIGARGESVVIKTGGLGELPIPIDAVGRIASARTATGYHRKSLHWLDRASAERLVRRSAGNPNALERGGVESVHKAPEWDDDRVLLTNGDVLRGFISSIDANGMTIDTGTGPTTVPFRLVVAARLAHAVPPATPQPYAIVTLRDGARLTMTGLDWGDGGVEAKLRTQTTVRIDADRVVTVDVIGGRWEWLSDRHPVSYEQVPMLGPGWEYFAGRNVRGGPLLVAGQPYERGIGVHSRSNLVFELNGEYREFVTSFGIDDDSGPMADVKVVILVDGQRRFEKDHIRRGNLFGPIRLDVTRAGRIELIVDYGDNGDIQDRFDWVEPGLIR